MTKSTLPLSSIVLDWTVYPRHQLNTVGVASIAEALRAGHTMPPLVVDKTSKRLVDGFTRFHAYGKLHPPEHAVAVELRTYADDAALLRDAIATNVARGTDLSRWDLIRCVDLGAEKGMGTATIADLVHWRPEQLERYLSSRRATSLGGKQVAVKRSLRHLVGQHLTERQEQANDDLDGMSAGYHIRQLTTHLDAGTLPEDEPTRQGMERLAELATAWVQAHPVAEAVA